MLIKGNLNSNKTDILIDSCAKLLNQKGLARIRFLSLCKILRKRMNLQKKKEKLEIEALTNLNIYTFLGLYIIKFLKTGFWLKNKIKRR